MAFTDKILSRGDFNFSLVLSYFVTWFIALSQQMFSVYVCLRLVFYFLLWTFIFSAVLAVLEKTTGRCLFGNKSLGYYPWMTAAVIAVVLSLFIGISYAFTGDTTLTTMRLLTLLIGFLGGVAMIMWYFHTMVIKSS